MNSIFTTALSQTTYLLILIALGYMLMKLKLIPENSNTALSKLESLLLLPALMLSTFIHDFTVDRLSSTWIILLLSLGLEIIIVPIAILIGRLFYKTEYLQKIATYGMAFSNFGFMGCAVMKALYPDIFLEYTVFTIPLWIFIMLWGVPVLLMPKDEKNHGLRSRLKPLLNPMLICMLIGMIIGISGIDMPTPVMSAIDTLGSAMSPIAMLLTGMTLAKSELLSLIKKGKVWLLSAVRLLIIPVVFLLIFSLIPRGNVFSEAFVICAVSALAMPLGLNTIVIPTGYGLDTSDASSMALISHVLSILSLPLVFMLVEHFI